MRASVEDLVREVFQDVRKSFGSFGNTSELRNEWIRKHESAVKEIERVEERIKHVEDERLGRLRKIEEDDELAESTKPTITLTSNLEPELAKKYALIKSEDLFTEIYINEDSVATSEQARERWREKQPAVLESFASKPKTVKARSKNNALKVTRMRSDEVAVASNDLSCNREKPQRSIIRADDHRTILVARPTTVEFVNFERRETYERVVLIRNVGNSVAKYQLETRSPGSKFSVVLRSATGGRENLAPGIHAKMIVAFRSEDLEDCEERLVVKVQSGRPVIVVARAYRDPPILKGVCLEVSSDYIEDKKFDADNLSLIETCGSCENSSDDHWDDFDVVSSESSESDCISVPKESSPVCGSLSFAHIDCKKCFVGERKVVATRLTNTGGDGRFFVMSEIDWNSMSIDDITTKNLIVLNCFALWPAYFSLKRDEEIELLTYFFPDSHGVQVEKLYIVCDNLAVHPVELIGDGVTYDRDFVTIGENVDEVSSFEDRREGSCEYAIDLGVATPNGYPRSTVTVTNSSGMEIRYRWEKRSTNERERTNRFQTWSDLPLDRLGVKPSSGVFRPCSTKIFRISARTTNLSGESYRAVLQLILEDIPEAAIDEEHADRAEHCTSKRRLCETSVDLRAKEIEVWIRCCANLDLETPTSTNSNDDFHRRSSELPVHKSISA